MGADQVGMVAGIAPAHPRGQLAPVKKKWPWVCGGLLLEVAGAGAPTAYVLDKAHKEGLGGHITSATVRLAWHGTVHSKAGLAILIAGVVVFAIGAVVLARPFAKRRKTLWIAIPLAAIVGLLIVGALALLVVAIVAAADSGGGGSSGAGSGSSSSSPGHGGSGGTASVGTAVASTAAVPSGSGAGAAAGATSAAVASDPNPLWYGTGRQARRRRDDQAAEPPLVGPQDAPALDES